MSPASRARLEALLRSRCIAVVGASDRPGSFGRRLLENLSALGYPGEVFPVNLRLEALDWRHCHPSLSDLPRVPDCAAPATFPRWLPVK